MDSCLLLATKTRPLAMTGTILELPPVLGQVPAMPLKSCGREEPEGFPPKA